MLPSIYHPERDVLPVSLVAASLTLQAEIPQEAGKWARLGFAIHPYVLLVHVLFWLPVMRQKGKRV